jgi:hypothetical protein
MPKPQYSVNETIRRAIEILRGESAACGIRGSSDQVDAALAELEAPGPLDTSASDAEAQRITHLEASLRAILLSNNVATCHALARDALQE